MTGSTDITKFLGDLALSDSTAALNVRSQFWYLPSVLSERVIRELPCSMTCKNTGYLPGGKRSKLIMRPTNVQYFSVHMVTTTNGSVVIPDPSSQLRLNH